jgi:hypothetical protein
MEQPLKLAFGNINLKKIQFFLFNKFKIALVVSIRK